MCKIEIISRLKETVNNQYKMAMNKIYNEEFITILGELEDIMSRQGEPFKARAYQKASEVIMTYPENITTLTQLRGKPSMGKTIMSTLQEYIETKKVQTIETFKYDPLNALTKVFGIGPKKARDFIKDGIDTIDKLKKHPEKLTAAQKVGVEFYDDIQKKIPRDEIELYKETFVNILKRNNIPEGTHFEIVGSYRRGAPMSGDIDIIITNTNNNLLSFEEILNVLIKQNVITHVLSRGRSKSLTLARLPDHPSRRIDLLYSPPDEYAFAILYFTGSKAFNTMQRQKAVDLGYTLNEHGIHHFNKGEKGDKVDRHFSTEKDIFDFLGMEYKEPHERKEGRTQSTDMNMHINTIKTNGLECLHNLTEKDIETIIQQANQSYYGGKQSLMSDDLYDMICDYMETNYPKNPIPTAGHTDLKLTENMKHKAQLPFELWSMDKIKPDTCALEKWCKKYKGPYVLSCKLDGVSGLYISPNKLYTRGNGKIGQDISHMIPYLRLPKQKGLVVRGEIIIQKEVFRREYSNYFSNPRNFVAGVVNQKKCDMECLKHIDFIAYEVIEPSMKSSQQLEYLTDLDIEVVTFGIQSCVTTESLSDRLMDWRNTCKYEIDGIICCNDDIYARTSGNPEHAFAFKMVHKEQTAETKVVDVIWNVSKDGYLKPRVQIEPVVIGGAKIEYATGFNAKFIVENNIGIGAVISIIRSGDVIPHIQHVLRGAEVPRMPTSKYKWNNTSVDIMLEDYKTDYEVNQKILTLFFKTIEVDGLGAGNIKKIMDAGYTTIPDILSMSHEQFMAVDGFKQKLSDKLYHGIREQFNKAPLPILMEATNIFGRGFGKKKFQTILQNIPDVIVSNKSSTEKIQEVSKISGMANTTAEKFIDKLTEFKEWALCVGLEHDKLIFTSQQNTGINTMLQGKRIVLTGFRDKSLIEKIQQQGASISGSVSKQTDMVIVKDLQQETSKTHEAKTNGIPILSYLAFIDKYKLV